MPLTHKRLSHIRSSKKSKVLSLKMGCAAISIDDFEVAGHRGESSRGFINGEAYAGRAIYVI